MSRAEVRVGAQSPEVGASGMVVDQAPSPQNGSWTHPETPGEAQNGKSGKRGRRDRIRPPRANAPVLTQEQCLQVLSEVAMGGMERNRIAAARTLLEHYGALGSVDRKSRQAELAKLITIIGAERLLLPAGEPPVSASIDGSCEKAHEMGQPRGTEVPQMVHPTQTLRIPSQG